ncbi:hypothetical protein [Ruminococcus sp. RTP21484sp1_RTP21281st1_A2_RTP21281_210402]
MQIAGMIFQTGSSCKFAWL